MYAEADLMLNNGSPSDEGVEAMNRIVQRARGLNQELLSLKTIPRIWELRYVYTRRYFVGARP